MLCLLASLFAPPTRAQDIAQRLSVRAGESLVVPLSTVESVMSIDENTAQVVASPGGFTVLGRASGDTIVQVFTPTTMRVYVVNVLPPPPAPPGPPPIANINDRGAITSFWGDNRYQIRYSEASTQRNRFDHLLTFHGRAGKGEYQANAQFMTGGLGDELQYASVGWLSDAKDVSLEGGDTNARLFGSTSSSAVPLRGLRSNLTRKFGQDRGEWTGELFLGEMRGPADPYATRLVQPAAGTSLSGVYTPRAMPDLRLSFGGSMLAFSTERTSVVQPGDSGVLVGVAARAVHKNGLGFELRSGLSASAARVDGASPSSAPSFGLTAQYHNSDGTQRLDYENSAPGMVMPQGGGAMPGSQRVSGSFDRHAKGVSVVASANYSWIKDLYRETGGGLSYRIGSTLPVTRQTNLSLAGGQSSVALPINSVSGQHYMRESSQTYAGARLDHTPLSGRYSAVSELNFTNTNSTDGSSRGASGNVSVQRRRSPEGKWDAAATLSGMANQVRIKETTLAVDQPPLDVTVAGSAQGRLVQGPFESFGGLGLQIKASPSYRLSPTVNVGLRFTPTAAHQLVATFSTFRWMQGGEWNYSASVSYTYHFGDAVHAAPIFEFMSYGVVEGRVCFDENSDGECSGSEAPVAGIPLVLSNGARTTTAPDGSYRFERVKPGFYHLDVDEAAVREKGRPTTVLAASFDLAVRGSESRNFAVARACRIRGHLVHDLDLNGRIDEGEPLFGGPLVVASGEGGTFQARVNNTGTFALTVPCGEYGLEIDPASLPAMHSAGDEEEVRVTTKANDTPVAKLLVTSIRTISGTVFIDKNGNGEQDEGEPIVSGARVRFGHTSGQTDETGAFLLRRLPAGAGEISVDAASLPAGLRPGASVKKSLPNDASALEDVRLPVVPEP